jgi:hypothetical protein
MTAASNNSLTAVSSSGRPGVVGGGVALPSLGIPTPSLAGVLTGIKLPPLFSLPGARAEPLAALKPTAEKTDEEKPSAYVLGENNLKFLACHHPPHLLWAIWVQN